jgi:hypothetical protein
VVGGIRGHWVADAVETGIDGVSIVDFQRQIV